MDTLDSRYAGMVKLRSEGLTLQKIADSFGVCRERVRQIIGNTGHEHYEHKKKLTIQSIDTTNLSQLKRSDLKKMPGSWHSWSKAIGKVNHAIESNPVWKQAEDFVSSLLESSGIPNEQMAPTKPFDILVKKDGLRINVKSASAISRTGVGLKSKQWAFRVRQKDKSNCDFFVCVIWPLKELFVIPSGTANAPTIFCWPTMRPTIHKFKQYHNALHLLK